MTSPQAPPLTLLERLDLALAAHAVRDGLVLRNPSGWRPPWLQSNANEDGLWVARALGVRGMFVDPRDAADIARGGSASYAPTHQELHLVRGLTRVLVAARERAGRGVAPDGWFAVDMFRRLTDGVARFRNNTIRRDSPWDAIPGVPYPEAETLPDLLDHFREAEGYGDNGDFDALHPVRQAVRVLWRFGRISPFPDFNLLMALVLMNAHLAAKGYPMLLPLREDRVLLANLLTQPAPRRVVQVESRLVARFEQTVGA